jgi:hypothetical protein
VTKRASTELRSFVRKLATEKVILLSILLTTLGVIALIIWGIINHFCGAKCKVPMNKNHVSTPSKNGAKLLYFSVVLQIKIWKLLRTYI